MSKRLQELCPQISFQGYQTLYNDTGLFGIIFTLFNTANTAAVVEGIESELQRIAFDLTDGIIINRKQFLIKVFFSDELELAKKSLLPNIALQLDGSQSVADEVRYLL